MKFTFFQKKALLISANLIGISFTLIGASTATYAWFASRNVVDATGMSVKCSSPKDTMTYEVLKYNDDLKAGVSSTDPNDFYLPAYDQFITSKNYYCNAIIVATINISDGFTSSNNISITTTCDGIYKDSVTNKIASNTSNVVAFKSFVYSYKTADDTTTIVASDIDTTSVATRYESAVEKFNNINTSQSFVSDNNKTSDVVTTCNAGTGSYNATSVTVYFECIYNPTLVNNFITDLGYSMEGQIDLADDIVSISIGKGNN